MAGDRRATMGNMIASRDIEKVFPADEYSCVGIAGTAGLAIEMVRLFQIELEHYEKIEGTLLSLDGKANRLAAMIRGNLGMAMQGLAVVPLFAGFDLDTRHGPDLLLRRHRRPLRGDGLPHRRLRLAVRPRLAEEALPRRTCTDDDAVRAAVEALYDAADDDSATGGPDVGRRICPVVDVVDRRRAAAGSCPTHEIAAGGRRRSSPAPRRQPAEVPDDRRACRSTSRPSS